MVFRTRTSKETMEIFESFAKSEHLQPFVLAKLSIALSVRSGFKFSKDSMKDSLGLDLNRQTITGENDLLFKALIEMNEGRFIPDTEYFPDVLKAYLDNGAKLLQLEHKYARDFYVHLVELDKGI